MSERPATEHHSRPISAIDFSPLGDAGKAAPKRTWFRPVPVIISVALLISLLILWFLLTAKSVLIEISPRQSEFSISGGLVLNFSGQTLMRPGDYRIEAELDGYETLQQAFTVGSQDYQSLQLEMQKKPGKLAINTSPPAVEVLVDNQLKGVTPLTINDLKPGEHSIQLSKQRFLPQQRSIVVEGMDKTQNLEVELQPAWGLVTLATSPAGADVAVAGELRGTTPLTTEILQGGETVTIKLAGYKRWQQQLQVEAGESLNLPEIRLQPADGLVQINSIPAGASITVDGRFAGTTPAELQLQPDRQHQLVLFLNGYQNLRQTVFVKSAEELNLNLTLTARTAALRVISQPADAEVWIDGVRKGPAGQTYQLPAREHQLELRRNGYASQRMAVSPKPGVEQVVRVALLTEKQARWASTPRQIVSPGGQSLRLFRPEVTFTMGASRREPGRRANEVMRDVRLERAFYLAEKEVTNEQFKRFQRQHSSSHVSGSTLDRPGQPVVNVSWQQAALYCNWLSEQAGLKPFYQVESGVVVGHDQNSKGYRLPTEAEWSWAARWNKQGMERFPWNGPFPPQGKVGNYADVSAAKIVGRVINTYNDGAATTNKVGSYNANQKGLYDLGGNVAEWTNDYYGIEFSLGGQAAVDPGGPEKGEFRVIRGSSWRHGNITELRLSFRDYGLEPRDDIGFRVARYAEQEGSQKK